MLASQHPTSRRSREPSPNTLSKNLSLSLSLAVASFEIQRPFWNACIQLGYSVCICGTAFNKLIRKKFVLALRIDRREGAGCHREEKHYMNFIYLFFHHPSVVSRGMVRVYISQLHSISSNLSHIYVRKLRHLSSPCEWVGCQSISHRSTEWGDQTRSKGTMTSP